MNSRQGKGSHNLPINLAPIHLSGNPPHSLCFKILVLYQGNVVDKHTWTFLHSCWFSVMASSPRSRPLKTGTRVVWLPIFISKDSTLLQSEENRVTESQQDQHPFLGAPSAPEDQALGYPLREDMNRPFSPPLPETLAVLLKHKHNRI